MKITIPPEILHDEDKFCKLLSDIEKENKKKITGIIQKGLSFLIIFDAS